MNSLIAMESPCPIASPLPTASLLPGTAVAMPGLDRMDAEEPTPRVISTEVARLIRCLHENLFDPELSVKMLKAKCGLRDNNISSQVKWETGAYLNDYIEQLRMEAAMALLRADEMTVAQVGWYVGYRHLQTFYRVFRRRCGGTPGEFRMRIRRAAASAGREHAFRRQSQAS